MKNEKKLSLKKETLRPLDNNQLVQLDGVVGGTGDSTVIDNTPLGMTITISEDAY